MAAYDDRPPEAYLYELGEQVELAISTKNIEGHYGGTNSEMNATPVGTIFTITGRRTRSSNGTIIRGYCVSENEWCWDERCLAPYSLEAVDMGSIEGFL